MNIMNVYEVLGCKLLKAEKKKAESARFCLLPSVRLKS